VKINWTGINGGWIPNPLWRQQKPTVVFEIDAEKNRDTEHKLPVGYWIENTVFYRRLLLFRS